MNSVWVEHRMPRSSAGSTADNNARDPTYPPTSSQDFRTESVLLLSTEANILQRADFTNREEQISYAAKKIQHISEASRDNLGRNDETPHLQCQGSPVGDEVLEALQRLTADIAHDVGRLHTAGRAATQAKDEKSRRCHLPNRKVRIALEVQNRVKRWKTEPCCSSCGCLETPQWRLGPKGPATLCNVCGLLYARRRLRRRAASGIVSVISS